MSGFQVRASRCGALGFWSSTVQGSGLASLQEFWCFGVILVRNRSTLAERPELLTHVG